MSFHLKYRPKNFEEFLGNEGVVNSLKDLLRKQEHPHVYLFYGSRGTGKTTLARILASELKCQKNDIVEINAANNRGIDTSRQIIEIMQYKPLFGENRVYIMDEIHRNTIDAQNALLKAFEDTPNHVYFILCTTDPSKLLKTIKDRCVSFELKKLFSRKLARLLIKIRDLEKGCVKSSVIHLIAKEVDSNRQALILLEKVLNIEDENEAKNLIQKVDEEDIQIIELCRALFKNDNWNEVRIILKVLTEDPETIRRIILGYMGSVLLNSDKSDKSIRAAMIIECFKIPFYDIGKPGLIGACFSVFN